MPSPSQRPGWTGDRDMSGEGGTGGGRAMLRPMSGGTRTQRRLRPGDAARFSGEGLYDAVGRQIAAADCLAEKELRESWEVARKVLRRHRGGRVLDLAGGHGLVGFLMLLQDRRTPSVRVVDRRIPAYVPRLRDALAERWPALVERWEHVQGDVAAVRTEPGDRVLGVHACGALTDRVLDVALAGRCRVAVLPCCHSEAKQDAGGLTGWLPHDLAVDTLRAARLRAGDFKVHTTTVDPQITPKNRLLIGTPTEPMEEGPPEEVP